MSEEAPYIETIPYVQLLRMIARRYMAMQKCEKGSKEYGILEFHYKRAVAEKKRREQL